MGKLIVLIFLPALLATFSRDRDLHLNEYGKKEKLFYFLLVVFLVLFAGLRIRYNDTEPYLSIYDEPNSPLLSEFLGSKFELFDYWGYNFVKALMKTLGMDNHMYLMLFTAFYTSVYLWFIRKYAQDCLPMAIFLFVVNGYTFLWAAIKQVTATAFALIAMDRIIRKKYIGFVFWMFIAILFHPSAIIFFLVPLLFGAKPWTLRTYLLIGILAIMGISMEVTSDFLDGFLGYDTAEILDHTVNPIRFLVTVAPIVLSFLFRRQLYEDSDRTVDIIFHIHVCEVMFMFWALFGNPIMFARISAYFSVGNWLSLSWMLGKLRKNVSTNIIARQLQFIVCACYSFVFVYQFQEGGGFNAQFEQMSLSTFMHSFTSWVGGLL